MLYYLLFFTLFGLLLWMAKVYKRLDEIPISSIFFLLFALSAIRYGLGRDFEIYHYAYLVPRGGPESHFEPLWKGLNDALRWLGASFGLWLMITSAAFIALMYRGIRLMSDSVVLSLLCMVAIYSVYFESMNLVRQHIAMAVCFATTPWLLQRKWLHWLLSMAVATLIHKSALFALIILPIGLLSWNTYALLSITVGGVIMGSLFVTLVTKVEIFKHLVGDYFFYIQEAYSPEADTGLYKLFLTVTACLLIYVRTTLQKADKKRLSFFFSMVIVSIAIYNATIGFEVAMRLMFYPFVFLIILLPNIVALRCKNGYRNLIIYAIIVSFGIFMLKTITNPEEPYYHYRTIFTPQRHYQ